MQVAVNDKNDLFELNSLKVEKVDNNYIKKQLIQCLKKKN